MITIYRRHLASCPHRSRRERRCRCPIWAQGTLQGERIRKSLDLTSWERAQGMVRDWESLGKFGEKPKAITVEGACASYLADCGQRNLAKESLKKYRCDLNELQAYAGRIGVLLLEEVSIEEVRDFRGTWKNAPLSAGKKLERLRSFFRYCQESKWIETNPARGIKAPQVKDRPTLPFTEDEMARMLAATIDRRLKAFILVLRYSGLRIGDAALLTTEHVQAGKIFLYTAKTGTPVWIPIPAFVEDELAKIPLRGTHYFLAGDSTKRETVPKWWSKRLKELFTVAKIPHGRAHRLRDTFAVSLLMRGVPIEQVSVLLGHQNIRITQKHYSPWERTRQEKLEELVRSTWVKEQPKERPARLM